MGQLRNWKGHNLYLPQVFLCVSVFIKRHPVTTYYALVFAISWGAGLAVIGPSGFLGTVPISAVQFMLLVVLVLLAGPCVSGILSAALVRGRAGLRDVQSRLLRWRVGARWYAVALLSAPLLMATIIYALTPGIVTTPTGLAFWFPASRWGYWSRSARS